MASVSSPNHDGYPLFCEACGRGLSGASDEDATELGWRIAWDGWLCRECDASERVRAAKRAGTGEHSEQ